MYIIKNIPLAGKHFEKSFSFLVRLLKYLMHIYYRGPQTFSWDSFISNFFFFSLFKDFIISREGGEKEGEKHQCVVASCAPSPADPARDPGMGIKPATPWFTGRHSIR